MMNILKILSFYIYIDKHDYFQTCFSKLISSLHFYPARNGGEEIKNRERVEKCRKRVAHELHCIALKRDPLTESVS